MSTTQTRPHDVPVNAPLQPHFSTPEDIIEWLDFTYEPALASRDRDIVPGLTRAIAAHVTIADGDDEAAAMFTENIRIAKGLLSQFKSHKTIEKAAALEASRTYDGWFDKFNAPLTAAIEKASKILLAYGQRKQRLEQEQREKEVREAQKQARRAAAAAQSAMRRKAGPEQTAAALSEAADAADQASQAIVRANERPAAMSRTRGVYGGLSTVRKTWTYEVEDIGLVPREYLTIDRDKIEAAKKVRDPKTNRPATNIPGIRWVAVDTLGVR